MANPVVQKSDSRQKSLAGQKGGRARWGIPVPEGTDGDIYIARCERMLAEAVAGAPSLTSAQHDKLLTLFTSSLASLATGEAIPVRDNS